jgi:hypothetical protein
MNSNQRCPRCEDGLVVTYRTKTTFAFRIRYVRCKNCGATGKHLLGRKKGEFFVPTVGTDLIDSDDSPATIEADQ